MLFESMQQFKDSWSSFAWSLNEYFEAGKEVQVDIRDPVRSTFDNAKLHAVLEPIRTQAIFDIRREGMLVRVYCREYEAEVFKTLMVKYFCDEKRGMGEALKNDMRSEVCPWTGERTMIRPSTTQWSKEIVSEFCHCMRALAAESKQPVIMDKRAMAVYEEWMKEKG